MLGQFKWEVETCMVDERADPRTEDRSSFPESKMTRRRALSFLAGGALGAAVMFYFGFPNSGVSGDANGDRLPPDTSTTAEGGGTQPHDQSWTTTTETGGGQRSPMAAKIMGTTTLDTNLL
jgi:uncharacterized membrane protein